MRTYIFAIGGTGARVLRSLTMLLASGVEGTDTEKEIIPIVIDYDGDNGDTERTQDVLEKYQKIHSAAYGNKILDHQEHYFCTPMKSLRELIDDETILSQNVRYGVPLERMDKETTYSGYIDYSSLNISNGTLPTRRLLECLYSTEPAKDDQNKENLKAELHMKLYHGFRGCPNIGCVVTKQLLDNDALNQLPGLIQEGDKVFIIGSIFGGTGASGIPMLLDFFKSGKYGESFNKNKVGVLAVTPYFNLNWVDDKKSPIDSNTFIAKTKAALTAYEETVYQTADAVYMVGDDKVAQPFENIEGGTRQKNSANVVELVGAMMAIDFMRKDDSSLEHSFFEFGLQNNHDSTTPLVYDDFYEQTTKPYFDPMTRYVIFKHFCQQYVFKKQWAASDYFVGNDSGLEKNNPFFGNLEAFYKEFELWITELEDRKYRPLKLFNLNAESYDKLLEYRNLEDCIKEMNIRQYMSESCGDPSKKGDGSNNAKKYEGHPEELFFVNAYNALCRIQTDINKQSSKNKKSDK